jgi:hypothetical protein
VYLDITRQEVRGSPECAHQLVAIFQIHE